MNHGAVISLCTLICLRLHGSNSYISPENFTKLMNTCEIKYKLEDLHISKNQFRSLIEGMREFVKKNKYSIFDLE